MAKIKTAGFFKQPTASVLVHEEDARINVQSAAETNEEGDSATNEKKESLPPRVVMLPEELMLQVQEIAVKLKEMGLTAMAQSIISLYKTVANDRFTVAIAGEFSRGKSTLINKLLDTEMLPVANLPTTALLTQITYGKTNQIRVIGKDGRVQKELPLTESSWEGLTASNFGEKEPEGHVVVTINNEWLGKYGITILDTPGAGDLEEKRARVIERSLKCTDAAIIAVSATAPLSMTEVEFIRTKILATKVPFIALAITKLDLIPESERKGVVDFLYKKLQQLKISVPVVVLDNSVDYSIDNHKPFVGLDQLRKLIVTWMAYPSRRELKSEWLRNNVSLILDSAIKMLQQQKEILEAKGLEREKLITEKEMALEAVHEQWASLCEAIKDRADKCVHEFSMKAETGGETIIETLQHEVARQPNPKEWVDKDYAYRVKRELTALSLSLDAFVARQVALDTKWLNTQLNRKFKELIEIDQESLSASEDFQPNVHENIVNLDDLKAAGDKASMATVAVTAGAALLFAATAGLPVMLATMGVGTGSKIITGRIFAKKIAQQREEVQKLIALEIPRIIKDASSDSESKIKLLYHSLIQETVQTENRWMNTQSQLIRQAVTSTSSDDEAKVIEKIKSLSTLKENLLNNNTTDGCN